MIPFVYSPPCDAAGPIPGGATAVGGSSAGQRFTGRGTPMSAEGDIPFSFLAWIDRSLTEKTAAEPGGEGSVVPQPCPQEMNGLPADRFQPQTAGLPAAGVPDGSLGRVAHYAGPVTESQTPSSSNLPDVNGGRAPEAPLKQTTPVSVPWQAADPTAASGPSEQNSNANGPAGMDLAAAAADSRRTEAPAAGLNLAVQTASFREVSRTGGDMTPSVNPAPVVPEHHLTGEAFLPAHPPTRQRAPFSATPTAAAHEQPVDVGAAPHGHGHLSATMMAEAGPSPHPLRRHFEQSSRFEGQFDGAQTVAFKPADSETMPTPADAFAKQHALPEQTGEPLDRFHHASNTGSGANGAGGSAAEPSQSHVSPDSGKSALAVLHAPAADKQLVSPSGSLDKAHTASVRAFQATVMDQIVGKAALRTVNGRSEIQIHLKPDFLGSVQMTVAGDRDQMVVRILTEQPMVKEIIETHLHQLKAELHHQGLTIDRFEVMVKPDVDQQANRDSFAHNTNHQSSQHGRRQGREPNPQNPSRENSGQAMQERSQGSGINYFA